MPDPFANATEGLDSPPINAFAITPNDSTDLPTSTREILIGNGVGQIQVLMVGDTTPIVIKGLYTGHKYRLRIKRVYATNTLATDIVGFC